MKKIIVCFVAITLSFLMISSATAVVTSSSITSRNVLEQQQSYEKPLCFGLLLKIFKLIAEMYLKFVIVWAFYSSMFIEAFNLPYTLFWMIVASMLMFFPALISVIGTTIT